MPTSGSYNWTLNRDQVITGALRKLAVLPSGGTPSTNQLNDATEALNALVKAFQADGMPLWAVTHYDFTTTAGTNSYTIGIGQTLNTVAPLKVFQAFYTLENGNNIPMNVYNRYDFNMLPQSPSYEGNPVNLYYQPLVDTGTITLWPSPSTSTTTITIHYQRPYQDMDSASDAFDFPAYWMQALIFNLAWTLSPEYGIPPVDRDKLAAEAKYWKQEALSYGSEEGGLFFQPDLRR